MSKVKIMIWALVLAAVVFIASLFFLLPGPEERLLLAVWAGNTVKVKALLEKGLDREYGKYREAFRQALLYRSPGIVQAFVDAESENREEWVLLKAADAGRPEIVRLLIEAGWGINGANEKGETPLFIAASHISSQHGETVRFLVERGADVNAVTEYGCTPYTAFMGALDFTEQYDSETITEEDKKEFEEIKRLLQREPDRFLFEAIEKRSVQRAAQALDRGASLNTRDEHGNPPLVRSALHHDEPMIRFLTARGADTDPKKLTQSKVTPLRALFMGNIRGEGILSMVRFLVENGADINRRGPLGESLLEPAVVHDFISEMEYLIGRGLDVNSPNEHGKTPLMTAALIGNVKALEQLIRSGAVMDPKDYAGRNALFYAVEFGQREALRALLASGGDVNTAIEGENDFRAGQTLLMYTAAYGVSLNDELEKCHFLAGKTRSRH